MSNIMVSSCSVELDLDVCDHILFEKYIYISALEMVSLGNQHCAKCIGKLSFPIYGSTLHKQDHTVSIKHN